MIAADEQRADAYPSRVGAADAILPRLDPVVHGRPGPDAPLDADRIASYERDGFLFLPGFLTPDEAERTLRAGRELMDAPALRGSEDVIAEPDSGQVRSVFRCHRHDPLLDRLCRHPRLVAIARFLSGGDVYLHQTRINYKGGFRGREFYWHSDFETWHVEDGMPRMRALSASISLTESNRHNGPLMVIPGSHRHYLACAGETPPEHYKRSLRKQEYGVPSDEHLAWLVEQGGIEAPTGPPGSVLLFDCNTMHGSASNITPWPRCNLFVVYNSTENRLEAPFGGLPPRPEHVASRDDAPALRPAEDGE